MANKNKAPYDLIKKRAENKGLLDARTNAQLTTKHSKHSVSGQFLPKNRIQSNSNSVQNQSTLSHSKNLNCSKTLINAINFKTMSRTDTKNISGGFIPAELKTTKPRGLTVSVDWRNTSDREESLSDQRWHKRPPTKDKQMKKIKSSPQSTSTAQVADARELIPRPKQSNFPKIIFGDSSTSKPTVVERNSSQTAKSQTDTARSNIATQTTINTEVENGTTKSTTATQTNNNTGDDPLVEKEIWVSRVDPSVCLQEETTPNVEPPTMTTSSQLEASHNEIMDTVVATVEKATETDEDTPLFRPKLQKVLGIPFMATATKKDRNLRPLKNFVKKRDWDAIKASYGQYWFNILNRLHDREDCLLIDERIVIPSQLRQTVLGSLHLTHPVSTAM